jgi:outer membrane protein OmpA-like peptidoglycan-associated protein
MLQSGLVAPSPWLAIGRLCVRSVVVLTVAAGLADTPAQAQNSAVTVDRSVLEALGPADSTANHLRLHRPVEPAQQRAKPSTGKSAPLQAGNNPPAAADAAAPAPVPQAALAPPTATLPSPVTPTPAPAVATPAPAANPAPAAPAEQIVFQPDDANLADDAKQELDRLAARLGADARLYVQLVAYAGTGGDASQARRLSLTRALAARSYLVDHGVEIKQIDVRPLGNKSEPGTVPDRVDLMVTQR